MSLTPEKKPTLWQVIMSVLAAIFGVQSAKARDRDFTHGNPVIFIVVGIIVVTLFVLTLYLLVQWIIAEAGNVG